MKLPDCDERKEGPFDSQLCLIAIKNDDSDIVMGEDLGIKKIFFCEWRLRKKICHKKRS